MEKNCGMEGEEGEGGWRGGEILEHFQSRLKALEEGVLRSGRGSVLEPLPLPPSELQLRALRSGSYSGSPALFPASWMPPWSPAPLPPSSSSSIPARLCSLLSGILQVEVFRLRYRVDETEQGCDYHGYGRDGMGKACGEESLLGDKPSQAFLHPIPISSTEVLDFGTFVSEGSSLYSAPKSQLLYLTWRSLPDIEKIGNVDCEGSSSSLPSEFRFFIESLFHPSTTPPLISKEPIKQRNFWMGALVTSRLHFDALDNIHVCLSGKKRFHLYSPMDLPNLYPDPWKEGQLNNFSSLQSIFLANPECHPRFFQHAKCLIAEVDEGKAIFVPAGWWHEVFTLEETISMNTWFGPSQNASLRPTLLHLKSDKYLQFMLDRL